MTWNLPFIIKESDIEHAHRFLQSRVDRGVTCPHKLKRLLHRRWGWECSGATCLKIVRDFLSTRRST